MPIDFGKVMKSIREKNGWTLEEMATRLGTTKQALSKYERGERTPKITAVARFAEILNIPLETFVGEDARNDSILSDNDKNRLEALHQNPRLGLLFDRSRKMSHADVEFMLQMADRILKERDGDE